MATSDKHVSSGAPTDVDKEYGLEQYRRNFVGVLHRYLDTQKEHNQLIKQNREQFMPSDISSEHSPVKLNSVQPSDSDNSKQMKNLQKRVNELEAINDSLRQRMSIDETLLTEEASSETEPSGGDPAVSAPQLRLQRDKLRQELKKSSEHKKKMEQYSVEAKQQAQRLSAENEQLKESLKTVQAEIEQLKAQGHSEPRPQAHTLKPTAEGFAKLGQFEQRMESLRQQARLQLVHEEAEQMAKEMFEGMKKKHYLQQHFTNPGELTVHQLVDVSDCIDVDAAPSLAQELNVFDQYQRFVSFANGKRAVLYTLIAWLDLNSNLDNPREVLDHALISIGYKSLTVAADSDLKLLAEHITHTEKLSNAWQTLALFLDCNMESSFLDGLKKMAPADATHKLLKTWHASFAGDAKVELVNCLEKLELKSLAQHFQEGTLSTYHPIT